MSYSDLRKKYGLTTDEEEENRRPSKDDYAALQKKHGISYDTVDDNYINTFIADSSNFLDSAQSDYDKVGWSNASSTYDTRYKTWQDLNARSANISIWLQSNKGNLDKETYKTLSSAIDLYRSESARSMTYFTRAKDTTSQYATEDEYNDAVEEWQKYYDKWGHYSEAVDFSDVASYRKYGNPTKEDLEYYDAATNNAYFDFDKSEDGMGNPLIEIQDDGRGGGLFNKWFGPSGTIIVSSIADDAKYKVRDPLGYFLEASENERWEGYGKDDEIRGRGDKILAEGVLNHWEQMTEDEINTYYYLLGTRGLDTAMEFVNDTTEKRNARWGAIEAQKLQSIDNGLEKVLSYGMFSIEAGLDQWGTGVAQALTSEELPTSGTQYANQVLLNDLDGFAKYAYQAGNTVGNMLPSILISNGLGAAGAGAKFAQGVGSFAMGFSAGGNAYGQALKEGYSEGQARTYGILVGASEATLQNLIGGIGSLGGITDDILLAKASMIDNSLLRLSAKFGISVGSEIVEEELQLFLEPAFKSIIMGEDYNAPKVDEILETAIVTFLSTGALEGPSTIATDIAESRQLIDTGRTIMGSETGVAELLNLASEMSGASAEDIQKSLTKQSNKVSERMEAGSKSNNTARKVAKLYDTVQTAKTSQNQADIVKSLTRERNGFSEKDATAIAEALVAQSNGQELTPKQSRLLNSYKDDVRVQNAAKTIVANEKSTMGQRNQKVAQLGQNIAFEAAVKEFTKQQYTEKEFTPEGKFEVATDGKALDKDGNTIDIKGVASIRKGELLLDLGDGKTINAKDVSYSDKNAALIYEAVANLGDRINAETANKLIKQYDGKNAQVFARGIAQAYTYGFYGISKSELNGKLASELTTAQINAAYELGKQYRPVKDMADKANAKVKKAPGEKGVYYRDKDGNATDIRSWLKENESGLKDIQKTGIEMMEKMSEMLGIRFNVFESWTENGETYYLDENGEKQVGDPNGFYDRNTGEIYIDLHAGVEMRGGEIIHPGTIIFTVAHEMTHFMRQFSPAEFTKIAKIVFQHGGMKGSITELVALKQAKAKAKGKPLSYDAALEEVVADGMETILKNGKVVEFMADVKKQDQTAWEKLKEWFQNLAEFLKEMVEAYSSYSAQSTEGARVAEFSQKLLNQIEQIWAKGALDAGDAYRAAQEQFSTANMQGNADGAVVHNEATEALTDDSMFHMRTEFEAMPKQVMSLSSGEGKILGDIDGLESKNVKGLTNKSINGYTGRDVRAFAMKNSGFTQAQIQRVNAFMDNMADFMKKAGVTYKFIGLEDVEKAQLHYTYNADGSIKSIVLSAMVKNGDYPVNFDLSSICKKREAMSALINKLAKRGSLDNGTVKLTPANIFAINTALKDAGYETACLGCFVESKRYNSMEWAKTFCNKWNAAVKKINPNATYFGYGDATFNEDSFTLEQAVKVDEAATKYITTTKTERLANALKKYQAKEEAGLPLVESFSKAAKDRLVKSDTISDELKDKYLNCDPTTLNMADVEFLLENGILPGANLSNKQAVTEMVKSGEAYQHLLRPSDLLTDRGISKLEALPNFHGVLYGHYGSGTPKLMQSYTPYNSEIALLPANKNKDQSLAEYLYSIAGVRMQSFSDFQIQNIYDYLQMVGDLAARKLPAHAYTKEISFAKLLGMTGIKTNLSVMFDIDPMVDKAHAGLTKLNKLVHRGEYAKVVLEDAQGKWVYNIGDYQTQRMFAEAFPDEAKRFLQSIGFADAVKLQSTPGYSANCGIIGVGYSDLGIFAMLDDNRIRYIIPYHASSLPAEIKVATHIEIGTDYTSYQNNMKIDSIVDRNGNKVEWSVKEAYKRLGNGQAVINELNDKIRNEGWVVKTKKAQTGHGTYGLYEDLQQTNDPRQTASNFMDWCAKNGTLPLFYQFASHENYYKLIYDYNVYDCVTEEYAPQQAVTNTYPTMVDGQVQPGNVTDGGFNTEYLQETAEKQMAFMNKYNENRDAFLEELADDIDAGTMFSNRDADEDRGIKFADRNPMLTAADLEEYLRTGQTMHTRNKKQRMLEAGKNPILTTIADVKAFMDNVIRGKAGGEVRAFGKVGNRLAAAIKDIRNSLDLTGNYLELNADDLREAYKRHSTPKEAGDVPLTEADFERIPEYLDEFDGVLSVNEHNGKVDVHIYKRVSEDYVRILAVSSKERKSLQVTKLIGVSSEKFETTYAKKIERTTGSLRSKSEESEGSNPSTKAQHTAGGLSGASIAQIQDDVKMSDRDNLTPDQQKHFDYNQKQSTVGSTLKTLKGSAIKRSTKYGVGKEIGGEIYFHKDYAEEILPDEVLSQALHLLEENHPGFEYNCLKYNPKTGVVAFQESPDFDSAREPVVGDYVSVNTDTGVVKTGHSNYIWHHKWNWVKNDYSGFDVEESWNWSKEWLSTLTEVSDGNGIERWNAQLDKFGLNHDGVMYSDRDQEYDSKDTSVKILPATFTKFGLKATDRVLDWGGGQYDIAKKAVEIGYPGIKFEVVDAFNRTKSHNNRILEEYAENPATVLTINNVLNVIKETDIIEDVIRESKEYLADGGVCYIKIYEGNDTDGKTGNGKVTSSGWQNNQPAEWYKPFAQKYYQYVERVGDILVASDNPIDKKALPKVSKETAGVMRDKVKEIAKAEPSMRESLYSDRDSDGNILSKAQQEFFKDSKVRDANGNLLKVFHGTPKKFTTFRQGVAEGWGEGIYFTDNPEAAKEFGDNIVEAYLNITNPFNIDTMSYYDLDVESTKAYQNFDKKQWQRWHDEYDTYEEYREDGMGVDISLIYEEYVDVFNKILRELGYDGIIADSSNNIDGLEIVAFRENQPKLTSNTNPTDSDDLRFSDRDTESVSNRSLLANAFEGIITNPIEKQKIQEYKGRVAELDAEEKKLREINAQIRELSFGKGPRDTKKIKALRFDAVQTVNRITTLDKMLFRLEAATPLQNILNREKNLVRKREKQKSKEALAAQKAEFEAKQKETIDKWRENRKTAVAKARETAEKRDARAKLQNLVLDTVKWISYPAKTDVKCPDILKKPYADFLNGIDLSSKRLADGGDATKNDLRLANAMDSLATALDKIMISQDPSQDVDNVLDTGYLDLPADFVQKLRDITENIKAMMVEGEYVVNTMTAAEVRQLSQMIRTLNHAIKTMSKLYANLRFANIEALGFDTMEFIDALGEIEKTGGIKDFVQWDNALPYYAFKRFGKGGESVFEGLMDAQDKLAFLAQEIFNFRDKAWTDKEAKAWSEDTHTINLPNGTELTLTTADAMSIYCLSRREQGLQHLLGGGTRVMGIQKGSKKAKDSRSLLTIEDISAINSSLTDRQKKVAEDIQAFMSTVCSDWGNEVSMKRFLTKEFNEKFYFPIESNDENLPTKDPAAQQSDLFRLLNISATKPITPGANNEVIIRNIFDVFTGHASDMARLNAYGMPLLDYMKWLNYREKTANEEGQITVRGVRKSMEQAFGNAAKSYVLNLVKDVNGRPSDGGEPNILMKWMRNAKTASVGSSLRVATLQVTSYPRASLVLSPKSLALGLTKIPNIKRAMKYCGIALWKSFGFYDTNISRSIEDQMKGVKDVKQKLIELSLKGAEWGDAITWGALWNACEYEVAKTTKNKVGSEEFYQEVGKKLREVVYRTQVVDSTLTRSQLMRSKRGMAQEAAAFMSEPTLSANILMDAGLQFSMEKRRSGSAKTAWKNTGKYIGRAVAVYSIGQLAAALLEGLWDAWRDDEDEEFKKKYLDAFIENLALDLVPFNKIPIVSDVFEATLSMFGVGFYSSDKMSTTWLTQAVSAVSAWKSALSGESATTVYNALYKTTRAISSFYGVSFSGVMREGVALWNNTAGVYDTTLKVRQYELPKGDLGNELYEAIIAGNTRQADSLKAQFEDQNSMHSAVRKALRDNDPRIKEAAQAHLNGDPSERVRIAKLIIADGFVQDDVVAAINAEINAMTPDAGGSEPKKKGFYTVEDFAKEIANGDQATAYAAKADIIDTAQKNGKTAEKAEESFISSAKTALKEQFLAGNISEQETINALTTFCGIDEQDAMADVQYWAFRQEYPEIFADDQWFDAYYEKVADSGISIDVYMGYRDKVSTITGEGKKEKRMAVIHSLPITSAQKDALYFAEGWAESKLYEAPWH